MAITNLAYPSGEPTVQDTLWHVFSSNLTGQTNFKYVVDIYVGGVQQVRVKLYPEPSNGKAYFDAGPIVRNTMTYEWLTPKEEVFVCEPNVSGQIGQTYQYRLGEEYTGTVYANLASGNVTAYNWSAPLFKRKVSDTTTYQDVLFSNRPKEIKASLGDNIYIGARSLSSFIVNTYGGGNNYITGVPISLGGSKTYAQLNIGSTAINKVANVISDSTKYYEIPIEESKYYNRVIADGGVCEGLQCLNDALAELGESDAWRVTLNCNPKYQSYNLHFLNHLGVYDTAKFNLVSRLTMDATRNNYQKRDYSFDSNSVTYYDSNNKYVSSAINYLNKKDYTYKLTMDAPTDAEYEWLAELIGSPQIYMEVDGYYYPVSIKNTNFEFSKYVNNRLRVFEVDVEMNQTRYSQLR